jgi:hypothetical protein
MFTMDDLQPYYDNATLEINGLTYTLTKYEDMIGEVALWYNDQYYILATPDLDSVPVAVEVAKVENNDVNIIDSEEYNNEVNSFEEYVNVVKDIAKKIIDNQKKK